MLPAMGSLIGVEPLAVLRERRKFASRLSSASFHTIHAAAATQSDCFQSNFHSRVMQFIGEKQKRKGKRSARGAQKGNEEAD